MEDSQKTTEQDNETLIQEMLRDATSADVPSETLDNPVLHKGDETLPSPMTVKQLQTAGYVYIWDTRTHERSPCLYYMLPQKLRQRRPDGSYVFTTKEPKEKPKRGTLKCLLHADDPNRAFYDSLGLATCKKSNLTAPYMVEQHMKKRHPQEWAIIERERIQKEKAEDRALQQAILGTMTQAKPQKPAEGDAFTCEVCNKKFATKIALTGHKRKHK
jgi:hypothetical protein